MPVPTTVRGAGSPLTVDLVSGPVLAGRVLGVHSAVVYVEVGPRVLPLVRHDGLALPTAVRVPLPTTDASWSGVAVGDLAEVGHDGVVLHRLRVEVVRQWRPARVAAGPVRAVCGQLDVDAVVGRLVGAGPGLTPSGDDVLCGLLLAGRAVGAGWVCGLADAVRTSAPSRTSSLSASLLMAAADGYAVPQVAAFVREAVAGSRGDTAYGMALRRLLSVGHTSGAALALGVLAVVDARSARAVAVEHPVGLAWDTLGGILPMLCAMPEGAISA